MNEYSHEVTVIEMVPDPSIFRQLKQLALQMNIFGFYMFIPPYKSYNRASVIQGYTTGRRCATRICLPIIGMTLMALNVALFGLNAYGWYVISQVEGYLALVPVNIVITSLKVLQNCFHFITFMVLAKQFEACNRMIMTVASRYSELFNATFDIEDLIKRNWIFMGVIVVVTMGTRISRLIVEDYKMGSDALNDMSIVLTPLLQIWQVLPLLYFSCISNLVLQLITSLRIHLIHHTESLNLYYHQFLAYLKLVRKWNEAIDFFVIYSLFLSLVVLCMAIYYAVRADDAFNIDRNLPFMSQVMSYYSYGWCALQIFVAILYVSVVCTKGGEINCAIKSLTAPILERVSTNPDECYLQSLFIECIKDETMFFGIWKTIPFHRALFFKIGGILVTYSVLMIRQGKQMDNHSINRTMELQE